MIELDPPIPGMPESTIIIPTADHHICRAVETLRKALTKETVVDKLSCLTDAVAIIETIRNGYFRGEY